jgi:hypothetical protein
VTVLRTPQKAEPIMTLATTAGNGAVGMRFACTMLAAGSAEIAGRRAIATAREGIWQMICTASFAG